MYTCAHMWCVCMCCEVYGSNQRGPLFVVIYFMWPRMSYHNMQSKCILLKIWLYKIHNVRVEDNDNDMQRCILNKEMRTFILIFAICGCKLVTTNLWELWHQQLDTKNKLCSFGKGCDMPWIYRYNDGNSSRSLHKLKITNSHSLFSH